MLTGPQKHRQGQPQLVQPPTAKSSGINLPKRGWERVIYSMLEESMPPGERLPASSSKLGQRQILSCTAEWSCWLPKLHSSRYRTSQCSSAPACGPCYVVLELCSPYSSSNAPSPDLQALVLPQ